MLNLTDQAQNVVRALTQDPQAPETAGLRIAPGSDGLELLIVAEPAPGDALIENEGARVFVEPEAAQLLTAETLDAQVENGEVNFFLASPDAAASPDADSQPAPAQNTAPSADKLPE